MSAEPARLSSRFSSTSTSRPRHRRPRRERSVRNSPSHLLRRSRPGPRGRAPQRAKGRRRSPCPTRRCRAEDRSSQMPTSALSNRRRSGSRRRYRQDLSLVADLADPLVELDWVLLLPSVTEYWLHHQRRWLALGAVADRPAGAVHRAQRPPRESSQELDDTFVG